MQRYRQKVLHLTVSIVRDPALAEDMAQLAFMKAWRALPKFDGRAALSTWLYAIARKYGVKIDALQKINGIKDPTKLRDGMKLTIPPKN